MPKYRVIGRAFNGRAVGEEVRLTHTEARAFVALKRVERVKDAPKYETRAMSTEDAPKPKKRRYKRRDLTAEE